MLLNAISHRSSRWRTLVSKQYTLCLW